MWRKIRCDGESCKVLGFWVHLNKALLFQQRSPLSRSKSHQSDRESKPSSHPRRLPAAPSNLVVMSDRPLSNSSHQPSSTRSLRLERSLLITVYWTVRATRSKFPTPPIEPSIAVMLHLAPCPSPDTPMRAYAVWNISIAPPTIFFYKSGSDTTC